MGLGAAAESSAIFYGFSNSRSRFFDAELAREMVGDVSQDSSTERLEYCLANNTCVFSTRNTQKTTWCFHYGSFHPEASTLYSSLMTQLERHNLTMAQTKLTTRRILP